MEKREFYLIKLPDAFFKNEETGSNLKSLKKTVISRNNLRPSPSACSKFVLGILKCYFYDINISLSSFYGTWILVSSIYFETKFVISDFKNWKVDQITPLKRSYLYLFLMSSFVIDPIGRLLEIFPILVLFPIFHN